MYQTCTGTKKKHQMHQTCTGTKKNKKTKISRNYGSTSEQLLEFLFFCFFWCLSMFGASSGLFFFWCLSMFLYISCQDHDEKSVFYQGFRPSKCIKHRYLQCFIIIFNENSLPHGVPPSKILDIQIYYGILMVYYIG